MGSAVDIVIIAGLVLVPLAVIALALVIVLKD